jgi:hypothetical protein
MKHSESIEKLAPALVAAQAELTSITKDKVNPHFKSKYVTLDAIIEAVRPVLASHGLSIVQGGYGDLDVQPGIFGVETTLIHTSGEWLSTFVEVPLAKKDPQGAGSGLTYGRRYGLSALLSLATDEDDDANNASTPPKAAKAKPEAKPSARVVAAVDRLPNWPAPYKFANVLLKDAPKDELMRIIDWEPKPDKVETYAPLKEAIVMELERRRTDSDFNTPSPALKLTADDLPFDRG